MTNRVITIDHDADDDDDAMHIPWLAALLNVDTRSIRVIQRIQRCSRNETADIPEFCLETHDGHNHDPFVVPYIRLQLHQPRVMGIKGIDTQDTAESKWLDAFHVMLELLERAILCARHKDQYNTRVLLQCARVEAIRCDQIEVWWDLDILRNHYALTPGMRIVTYLEKCHIPGSK